MMNRIFLIPIIIFIFISCKIQPGSDRHYVDGDSTKVYRLRLNPTVGSRYSYTVNNGTEYKLEVDGKQVDNQSRSTVGITYTIGKDSSGNFLLNMVYDKIHLHTKSGDTEMEMDSEDATESPDPLERMLGLLKGTTIQILIGPEGELISIQGYDEIKNKILTQFVPGDTYGKEVAEKQWDQRIKEGLIKKNMEQLFRIFPDSAVHVGEKWKLSSSQKDEINLNTNNSFILKEIQGGRARIRSEGTISGDNGTTQLNGYEVTSSLKGEQEGEYVMETATGMLISSKINSEIAGTMSMMGRDIPVTIHTSMNMEGNRL